MGRVRVGVFGGSFDPPHLGHLAVATFALALSELDLVLVVPCHRHALSKQLTRFEDRLRMCELAFRDLRRVEVSDVEAGLGGISYTLHTLEHLLEAHPGWELSLVVGADALRDRESWYRFDRIGEIARLVAFERGGVVVNADHLLPAPPAISATEVREVLVRGDDASRLVPAAVLRYISEHELYIEP